MKAKLVLLKDNQEVQSFELEGKKSLMLGRAENADIKINDRAIGREHLVFAINNKAVMLQKRSKFGKVLLNGVEVSEAVLQPNDVMQLQDFQLKLVAAQSSEPTKVLTGNDSPALFAGEPLPGSSDAEGVADLDLAEPVQEPAESQPVAVSERPTQSKLDFNAVNTEASSQGFNTNNPNNIDNSDKTAMISQNSVLNKIVFSEGQANLTEYVIKKPEVSIGRGQNCDIIIYDKKASRRHVVIKKVGLNVVIKDLDTANGTLVNNQKITELELNSDDIIQIGDTAFKFLATSQDYLAVQQNQGFLNVPPEVGQDIDANINSGFIDNSNVAPATVNVGATAQAASLFSVAGAGASADLNLAGSSLKTKESLVDKFKRQPTIRKVMIVVGVIAVLMVLNGDEETKKTDKDPNRKIASVEKGDASYSALPIEKKQFVMNTYQLALDNYKTRQYEQAVLQADRILEILPGGYKDARNIKAYAQKAIEIQKANDEERRRKDLEEKLKVEIAELVQQAEQLLAQGDETKAKEVFAQVLEKDPDNATILRLRQEMEEREQKNKAAAELAKEQEFKLGELKKVLAEAQTLLKQQLYYQAIAKVSPAKMIFNGHEDLIAQAQKLVSSAKAEMASKTAPFLKEANDAMINQDYISARDGFYKVIKIDSQNEIAKKGLAKIRETLHDRAKRIYTDGVIAESVSDYKAAQDKFRECKDIAMTDDIYFGRCSRKFKRFELMARDTASVGGVVNPSSNGPTSNANRENADPEPPKFESQGE